jgi:hypothetical protein
MTVRPYPHTSAQVSEARPAGVEAALARLTAAAQGGPPARRWAHLVALLAGKELEHLTARYTGPATAAAPADA